MHTGENGPGLVCGGGDGGDDGLESGHLCRHPHWRPPRPASLQSQAQVQPSAPSISPILIPHSLLPTTIRTAQNEHNLAEGTHKQVCAVVDGDHDLHGHLSPHVSSVVADSGALYRFCCDGGSDWWCAHGHHGPVSARSPPIRQRPRDAWFRTGFPPALNICTWIAISSLLGWGCALTRQGECRAKAATRLIVHPASSCDPILIATPPLFFSHAASLGRGQAMLVLTDDLGKGLGPFAMAMLIVIFGSRTHALALAVCVGWTLAGVMLCCPYFTIEADEEETKRRVLAGEGPPTCCLE